MESPWPENLSIHCRRKATDELVRGRDFATQLQILLKKPVGYHGLESAEELVPKVLRSFTEALSVLNSGDHSDEVCQSNPAAPHVSSRSLDDRRSEGSGVSRKRSSTLKDRRGSYKKRKSLQTWTRASPSPIEDDYAWRKYGQKEILNAKHPRSYFRCTHKNDQGCQATKQVQRTDDELPVYRTVYSGQHTCKDLLKAPNLILDSNPRECSYLLSFKSNVSAKPNQDHYYHHHPFFSSFSSMKQEFKEEIPSDPTRNHLSSENNYLLLPDLTTFESSGPTTMYSPTPGSDTGDVVSGEYSMFSTSSKSLDVGGLIGGSVDDFDAFFRFDEDGFVG